MVTSWVCFCCLRTLRCACKMVAGGEVAAEEARNAQRLGLSECLTRENLCRVYPLPLGRKLVRNPVSLHSGYNKGRGFVNRERQEKSKWECSRFIGYKYFSVERRDCLRVCPTPRASSLSFADCEESTVSLCCRNAGGRHLQPVVEG